MISTLAILMAIHLNATAQLESIGTIVYVQWSKDELVLAADSRLEVDRSYSFSGLGNSSSYSDTGCKIATFGKKLVFAASGRARLTGGNHDWDGFAIANKEFERPTRKGTADQLSLKLAEAWGRAVKAELDNSGPRVFLGLNSRELAGGFFAEFEKTGSLSIAIADITYETSANGKNTIIVSAKSIPNEAEAYVLGHNEIINELSARQTKRAFQWANDLGLAMHGSDDPIAAGTIKVVEITIDNLPKTKTDANGRQFSVVGPPVAAVRLIRGKSAEWIEQGKCPAQ